MISFNLTKSWHSNRGYNCPDFISSYTGQIFFGIHIYPPYHPIFNFNLPSLHNGGTRRGSDEYGLQVCQNHHQVTSGHSRLTIGRIKSPFWFMHLYLKIWFTFFENQDFIFFDDVIFIWNFSSNAESFNWIKTNQTNNSLIPHLCLELLLSCL